MRIAVDAMGGDAGPEVVVPGAVQGARASNTELLLVGKSANIDPLVSTIDHAQVKIQIVDAPDVVEMGEHPVQATRKKRHSSIAVALGEVKAGRADAMVSAGNSGAVMTSALMVLGRIPGVRRPAIAGFLPGSAGASLVLDLGALTDPRPSHMVQFAGMGSIYVERALGKINPTVALLSNGEEPSKGNHLVQEVFSLLQNNPGINFVGNIEGKDMLKGNIDVIVTDGFTGNVALKVAEGTASLLTAVLREELTKSFARKLAAAVLKPAFDALRLKLDYARIGAAPLLGVDGVVLIAHGRSSELAIASAVARAVEIAETDMVDAIRASFATSRTTA
ncbi:MAG: phosphate acyltransferase PlsX [Thermomicrobiales bacterium]